MTILCTSVSYEICENRNEEVVENENDKKRKKMQIEIYIGTKE